MTKKRRKNDDDVGSDGSNDNESNQFMNEISSLFKVYLVGEQLVDDTEDIGDNSELFDECSEECDGELVEFGWFIPPVDPLWLG